MSEKFIPEYVDPYRYAEQKLSLNGKVNMTDMPRLGANIIEKQGNVTASLQFGMDEQGITYLKGQVEAVLTLQCQRCMEPYKYEIISDFALGIVNTIDEMDALPAHYEPALAKEGQLALRELIEDELILNLPIIPKHAPEDCKVELPYKEAGWEQGKGENPFHVLKKLKDKQDH